MSTKNPKVILVEWDTHRSVVDILEATVEEWDQSDKPLVLLNGTSGLKVPVQRAMLDYEGAKAILKGEKEARPQVVASSPQITFMFAGLGDQYKNMTRGLYREVPLFAAEIDRLAAILAPSGLDVKVLLYDDKEQEKPVNAFAAMAGRQAASDGWNTARERHMTLVITGLAMAGYLETIGLKADQVTGYSLGEYTAALQAGMWPMEKGLDMIGARAAQLDAVPEGAMLAVPYPVDKILPLLKGDTWISAYNGPANTIVAGSPDGIEATKEAFAEAKVLYKQVGTAQAVHTPLMQTSCEPLRELVEKIPARSLDKAFVSAIEAETYQRGETVTANYWAEHLVKPVRFSDTARLLTEQEGRVLIEIGPGVNLTALVRSAGQKGKATLVNTIRHAQLPKSDVEMLTEALARCWEAGVEIQWEKALTGKYLALAAGAGEEASDIDEQEVHSF